MLAEKESLLASAKSAEEKSGSLVKQLKKQDSKIEKEKYVSLCVTVRMHISPVMSLVFKVWVTSLACCMLCA